MTRLLRPMLGPASRLLLAAVGAAGLPASPVQAQASASPSTAAAAIAERLASDAIVIFQTRRLLRAQLPISLSGDPDMRALEKKWPGVTTELIGVMEPVIVSRLSLRLPEYRRQVAAVFDRAMTPAEITAANAFYASPTGQRLLTRMRDGVEFGALIDRQIKSGGKAPITGQDLRAAIAPAVQPAVSNLSSKDQLELMSFAMTSAGRKMNALSPQLLELSARFNNVADPEADRQIAEAVQALIARRTAPERRK